MVFVTGVMAVATWRMVGEVVRDRRLRVIEKKLDEFYMRLITLFASEIYRKNYDHVEEIIIGKRYLCGPKVLRILPEHFEAMRGAGSGFYFVFESRERYERWMRIADVIWEEAMEYVREYYELGGIKEYVIPRSKPKWKFMCREAELK